LTDALGVSAELDTECTLHLGEESGVWDSLAGLVFGDLRRREESE
jgi:hypothetical protein